MDGLESGVKCVFELGGNKKLLQILEQENNVTKEVF